MSEREIKDRVARMEAFEQEMRAKGKTPSKAWLMAKTTQGSITIHDPAFM